LLCFAFPSSYELDVWTVFCCLNIRTEGELYSVKAMSVYDEPVLEYYTTEKYSY
jgi:hypothetical protein